MSEILKKVEKSFLTKKQYEILRLRAKGLKQKEIAEILGTSRENVSILEKRAKEKIERARITLELFEMLDPIDVEIKEGTNLYDIPKIIYREADRHGIHIIYNTNCLIELIKTFAHDKIYSFKVRESFKIRILRNGKVLINVK